MLATIVLIIVSLSWPVVVELTPVDRRPYVGSSRDYSVIELILGYNGLDRCGESGGQGPAIG